ncbi:hypothetical protein M514_04701 [Trichuris suis]|uniref:Peptidase S1 domain-containing protein n=1 Tax=Trichuris suis TaxID=68888 RepID=A0A085N8M0_9BILA|nr:hypothetical protein M513_04701 [Trichuris suis]KFD65816.1 hypothetical protein M514_04701 [Trichuris suis]KHJ42320.1 hypothetical protein D918_07659 [Trichuris suis]
MTPMQWFLITALVIVAFSDARFHFRNKYKVHQKGKQPAPAAEEWSYSDDDDSVCGYINITKTEKEMLHQRKKLPHTLPFIAYVVKRHRHNYQPVCVATILPDADDESSSIVLTLTTCIESPQLLDHYKIFTGRKLPVPLNKTRKMYDIEEVLVDKKSPNLQYANAMVVKLSGSIPIDAKRQPICLPKPNAEMPKKSECILSVVRTDGRQQPYLIEVEPKSNKDCKKMHGESIQIDNKMEICGLDYRDGSFISRGGSLICEGEGGRWIQYGIYTHASHISDRMADRRSVSRIQKKGRPSVYINVANFTKLMQTSQNLERLSRINLMKLR